MSLLRKGSGCRSHLTAISWLLLCTAKVLISQRVNEKKEHEHDILDTCKSEKEVESTSYFLPHTAHMSGCG